MEKISFDQYREECDRLARRYAEEFAAGARTIVRNEAGSRREIENILSPSADAARSGFNDQVIARVLETASVAEREKLRPALVGIANSLRRSFPNPFQPGGYVIPPAHTPVSLTRLALGALLGSLTGWFLFSPHWFLTRTVIR